MSLQTWQETLVTANAGAGGPTITAAGAVTCLAPAWKVTLPNTYFYIGRMLRISAFGQISSVITTPGTARFDVRLGGTIVFDSLAILLDTVAAHVAVGFKLEIILTCRAAGSSANFMGYGSFTCEDILGVPATAPKGVLTAVLPWNTAPAVGANFDNTTANSCDVFFTQTVGTGSMTLQQYMVESLN